jgi:hypothetical protein
LASLRLRLLEAPRRLRLMSKLPRSPWGLIFENLGPEIFEFCGRNGAFHPKKPFEKVGGRSPPTFRIGFGKEMAVSITKIEDFQRKVLKTKPQGPVGKGGVRGSLEPGVPGVVSRFSTKLGLETPLDRPFSSCSAGGTRNQLRRPAARPFRDDGRAFPDSRLHAFVWLARRGSIDGLKEDGMLLPSPP